MSDLQQLVVNPNDRIVQAAAEETATTLVTQLGVAKAVGVAVVVVERMLIAILHMETPMPEQNVEMVQRLLSQLEAGVMDHEECCYTINGATGKVTVH